MDRFIDELYAHLGERGYQTRTISIDHLPLLQKEIEGFRDQVLLDDEFYQERLTWFHFQAPESLPRVQSVIVIAVPRPQTRAIFTWNGQRRPLIIHPTYTAYDRTREQAEDLLAKILSRKRYASAKAALPLKLLAARRGLSQYGRNNV